MNWNRQGQVQDWLVRPTFTLELLRATTLRISRTESFELFQTTGFRKNLSDLSLSTEWYRWLALNGAIFDYNGVLPNSRLVSLDHSKRFGVDLLLTYLLHPGTALYIGYSNVRENLVFDPLLSPALQRTAFPDTNNGRQVFIKLSYLLRL